VHPCTGSTARRGSRGIALLFHDHGTRKGWGVSVTPRPLFTRGKHPVPTVQEAGRAPGPIWTGAGSLAPTGIRSPDRPASNQSLYRLSYPAHHSSYAVIYFRITILIPTINYTKLTMQAAYKQTTGNYILLKYLYSDDSPCKSTIGLPLFARHYSPF
jgi:hypothetical protein